MIAQIMIALEGNEVTIFSDSIYETGILTNKGGCWIAYSPYAINKTFEARQVREIKVLSIGTVYIELF